MGKVDTLLTQRLLNPCALLRTLRVNMLRRNTVRRPGACLLCTPYSVVDVHRSAVVDLRAHVTLGFKKYRGSRIETSLWMDDGARLTIGSGTGRNAIYHGCDIQIFKSASLEIGSDTVINRNAQIICQDSISIGDGCLISRDVVIRDNDGGHKINVDGYQPAVPVTIGNHVWIGQGAMILKGARIGDGAIIGAGAIVTGRVKANALVMADPSRTFAKDISWEN
ncbi:MAG: acyltransferase [Bacteroidales bacterium]|nr:acyltransferase [Bacteroidales bacterium]